LGELNRPEDSMQVPVRTIAWTLVGMGLVPFVMGQDPAPRAAPAQTKAQPTPRKPQPRPHGQRFKVDPAMITVEDGDSLIITWGDRSNETVQILGIDTPEIRHLQRNIPFDQPHGLEAKAFAQGAFAAATDVEMIRSPQLDLYNRTLAYLFINGRNYSVLAIRARFSNETVEYFGDNGLPKEAAEVLAAAKNVGPLPFEAPYQFRARMHAVSDWMKQNGQYPAN